MHILSQKSKIILRGLYFSATSQKTRNLISHKLPIIYPSYYIKAGCIFVHVPKAAGTSISHALYGRSIPHLTAQQIRKLSTTNFNRLPTFAVVRNPWDRLVSAFLFAKAETTEVAVSKSTRRKTAKFNSFEDFVEYLYREKNNLNKMDFIFQEQNHFVCDMDQKKIVDHIFKLEQISELEEYLRNEHGCTSLHKKNKNSENKDYRKHYTSKTKKLVEAIYYKDISLFDYDF